MTVGSVRGKAILWTPFRVEQGRLSAGFPVVVEAVVSAAEKSVGGQVRL